MTTCDVLIRKQKLETLLEHIVGPSLSFFFYNLQISLFLSPLSCLSLLLFLFYRKSRPLSVHRLSPFHQRVVHDSFKSASPRGPGIDSRLTISRRLLLPWRPSCNRHWSHYITSHFSALRLHTYIQPCAHIPNLNPSWSPITIYLAMFWHTATSHCQEMFI